VFNDIYHFNLGVGSLPFSAFVVTGTITVSGVYLSVVLVAYVLFSKYTVYCLYNRYHMELRFVRNGDLALEARRPYGKRVHSYFAVRV